MCNYVVLYYIICQTKDKGKKQQTITESANYFKQYHID